MVDLLDPPPFDLTGQTGLGFHGFDGSVFAVGDVIECRDINALDLRQPPQESRLCLLLCEPLPITLQKLEDHFLAFTEDKEINERAQGFGIQKGRHPSGDDQGKSFGPKTAFDRKVSQIEEGQDVKEIVLERDGESEDVEVGKGSLGFERKKRRMGVQMFLKILGFGKENPFTEYVLDRIEAMVDGLKSQVGHSHIIMVGIDETNGDLPAPGLMDGPSLLFENGLCLLNEFP